jgi:predicted nucleotidyltransferase
MVEALNKLAKNGILLNYEDVVPICIKYNLSELSVFGSSIRDDFTENSDVDFLVAYRDIWNNDPWDFIYIKEDFVKLLNRNVDVVDRDAIKNPIRKKNILSSREIIYVYQ